MSIFEGHKSRASVITPVENDDGEWVRVEDVIALESLLKEAIVTLSKAHKHLEYCGYGDEWERNCARDSKLDECIITVLEKNNELLEASA
jgi:hypothetical protein